MPTPTSQVLIVTDDTRLGSALGETLESCGVDAVEVAPADATGRLAVEPPDFVFTDLDLSGADPLELVRRAGQILGPGRVLLLASDDSMDLVNDALALGSPWYLKKPVGLSEMAAAIRRVRTAGSLEPLTPQMIGSSPGVQTALKVAEQVASSGGHVLLMGEPGVGKRLMARLIHDRSPRALRPFGQFSCEGFRERVVDGELFGREAGSGSDARDGLLKLCHRGTLVIDEISKLPAKSQEHLIKCMILNSVRPIGSRSSSAPSDVRIIATTSTDLNEAVRSSDFVRELFDRISGAQAVLAPLRERRSDIPMLADHFVRRAGSRLGKKFKGITSDGLDRLMRHPWPGNVRELEEMVNQSTSRASGPWLAAEDLPALPDALGPSGIAPGATIQEIEKEAITRTLDLVGGSTSRAAQILNMSVRKIQYKLKEYRREAASALRSETVRSLPPQPQPVPTAKTKTTVFVADGEDA